MGKDANIKKLRQKKTEFITKQTKPIKGLFILKFVHQNIRGLRKKMGELLSHLHPDLPHVLCLTVHHL